MTNDRSNMRTDEFGLDRALSTKDALERDRLHRIGFARQVATALAPLSVKSSIVVSVEGAWGSGKTSVLSMVEALLGNGLDAESKPVIVSFNPWLIGNRDALLREFLKQLSRKIELSDHSETAKKVAREIDGYSKLIGLAKFIPGVEPIATVTKAILDALGKAAAHAAEEDQGIEHKKARVEEALTKLSRKVIVLVDDIDRLYPNEVFEIVRIIKAVADLPNVGYVLAFDPVYASEALKTLGVPNASAYLDKVIQTRLSIPTLSANSKLELINVGFDQLPEDARREFFANSNALLAEAYHFGLRDLLDQPRDFARLFNVVARMEPELRGEIVLADLLAFGALAIKASPVFDLLRRSPAMFVGPMPHEQAFTSRESAIKSGNQKRADAYAACPSPEATKCLVHFLFPLVKKEETGLHIGSYSGGRGRLANSNRLAVALQFALTGADTSIRSVQRFIDVPADRLEIGAALTATNCIDFLEALGDIAASRDDVSDDYVEELMLDIARLAENSAFVERRRNRSDVFDPPAALAVIWALIKVARSRNAKVVGKTAVRIARDPLALSVAGNLILAKRDDADANDNFHIPTDKLSTCRSAFAANVKKAAGDGALFSTPSPTYVLHCLASAVPTKCRAVFTAIKKADPSLDSFAAAVLSSSYDSVKGQAFSAPSPIELLTCFVSRAALETHAKQRLKDQSMTYPVRAAWRSFIERKKLYAIDGSSTRD